ncbi:MAG: DUF1028 domain-containing protein [Planctomycetota bacterium]
MQRQLLTFLLALVSLVSPLCATWSIILIDTRTGEIAIASATCITNFNLLTGVPVLVVGKGAGAAQSMLDVSGNNRLLIRDQLRLGTDPVQILAMLAASDPQHQSRQYGIVDVSGRMIGFSGTANGAYASDRVGRFGDIAYAIQGNVLTSGAVLAAAEIALFTTPGDLGEKLMAMMEAARSYGGDGRCSCAEENPTGCGSPPPGFTKSAHVGFMVIARRGDTDGNCNATLGCAGGSYYMRLNVVLGQVTSPDPVLQLRPLFENWKASQIGIPDQILSTVVFDSPDLPTNGVTRTKGIIVLRDRTGTRIAHGGATVRVTVDPQSLGNATPGVVRDLGDGSYEFDVTAGVAPFPTRFVITVDDGHGTRILAPNPQIAVSTDRLWVNRRQLSAAAGGTIDFTVQPRTVGGGNHLWIMLGSMSGTSPGVIIPPGFRLPLNVDTFFEATAAGVSSGLLPQFVGVTSPAGVSVTSLTLPPGVFTIPSGTDLSFAYVLLNPMTLTSNAVTVRITP